MVKKALGWMVAISAIILLTACGGGGTQTTTSTTKDIQSAKIVSASSADQSSLYVEWLPSPTESNETVYEVHVSKIRGFQPVDATKKLETKEKEASITGLEPNTLYYVAVVTREGNSRSVSLQLSAKTSSVSLKFVDGVTVEELNASQVIDKNDNNITLNRDIGDADYIVGDSDNIYLRKVLSVTPSGSSYIVETEKAAVGEVFSDLEFSLSYKMEDTQALPQTSKTLSQNRVTATYRWKRGSWLQSVQPAGTVSTLSKTTSGITVSSQWKSALGTYYKVTAPQSIALSVGDRLKQKIYIEQLLPFHSFTSGFIHDIEDQCAEVGGTFVEGTPDSCINIPVKVCNAYIYPRALSGGESNMPRLTREEDEYFIEWTPDQSNMDYEKGGEYLANIGVDVGMGDCSKENMIETVEVGDVQLLVGDELSSQLEFANGSDYEFASDDGSVVFTNRLSASFSPRIVLDGKFIDESLKEANAKLSATFGVEDLATLKMQLEDSHTFTPKPIYSKQFVKVVMAGPVPVIFTGQLKFMAVAEVNSTAKIDATLSTGMTFTLDYGLHYNGDSWEVVKDAKSTYRIRLEADGESETTMTVKLVPDFNIEIYELAAVHLLAEPYIYATAGVHGRVVAEASTTGTDYFDMDAYYHKMEAGTGMDLYAYAGAAWKTRLKFLKYPSDADYAEISNTDFYGDSEALSEYYEATRKYAQFTLFDRTPIAAIPTLSLDEVDTSERPPSGVNSRAIKVRIGYKNLKNPLYPVIGDEYIIKFESWDGAEAVTANAKASSTGVEGEYWVIPELNDDKSLSRVEMKFAAHSTLGIWARQLLYVPIDSIEASAAELPAYWADRYAIDRSDTQGDVDGDGFSNRLEFEYGTDPTDPQSRPSVENDDTTPPVITILGDNPATVTVGESYVDAGATAVDDVDGQVAVRIVSNDVNTSREGTYQVVYEAVDSSGNRATATRTVEVVTGATVDTTPPVITILGDNPAEVNVGETYIDAGATARDDVDGDVNVTVVRNTVDVNVAGEYEVVYSARDRAGNESNATRIVRVVDGTTTADFDNRVIAWDDEVASAYVDGKTYSYRFVLALYDDKSCSLVGLNMDIDETNADKEANTGSDNQVVTPDEALIDFAPCSWTVAGDKLTLTVTDDEIELNASLTQEDIKAGDRWDLCNNPDGCTVSRVYEVVSLQEGNISSHELTIMAEDGKIYDWSFTDDYRVTIREDGNDTVLFEGSWSLGSGYIDITDSNGSLVFRADDKGYRTAEFIDFTYSKGYIYDIVSLSSAVESLSIPLKKSGQIKSFDQYGNEVTDGSLKDDGYYQAGLSPEYTRDDTTGIVTDHVTNLQWQDNYSDNDGAVKSATWQDALDYCSALNLDGKGWRLPTARELDSIVNYGKSAPMVDPVFQEIVGIGYWSATTLSSDESSAWSVNFGTGARGDDAKTYELYVLCVRLKQ